jgi:hypothetical protein
MPDENYPKCDLPDQKYVSFCQQLVRRKSLVDAWLSNATPSPLIQDFVSNPPERWLEKWSGNAPKRRLDVGPTIDPSEFLKTVLPFFDIAVETRQMKGDDNDLRWVDPSCVIGDSAGWLRGRYDEERKRSALESCEIQVSNRLRTGKWENYKNDPRPQSMRIEPFGLYIAHEGKNRVAYYREIGRPMPTSIWFCHYIEPKDLVLIESSKGWKVELKGHGARDIEHCVDIVVPLLKAYGVPTLREPEVEHRAWLRRLMGNIFR